eukprot:1155306-Pelagomonas_calceolata.AAC.3
MGRRYEKQEDWRVFYNKAGAYAKPSALAAAAASSLASLPCSCGSNTTPAPPPLLPAMSPRAPEAVPPAEAWASPATAEARVGMAASSADDGPCTCVHGEQEEGVLPEAS